MALTNFVDRVTTITAGWLNSIDILWSTVFNGATTKETARTAISAVGIEDTIAELRLVPVANISNLDTIGILGHTTAGDGGGGHFYWSASSADADDNGITILPTGHVGNGRWKRINPGVWFGTTGAAQTFAVTDKAGFWTGDSPAGRVHRLADRVFFGGAIADTGAQVNSGSYLSPAANGANFSIRDAQLVSLADTGLIGITGASRSNDQVSTSTASIGVAGIVINNKTAGTAWGLYSDVQHESGATVSYGLEVAGKNKGADATRTSYSKINGVFGAFFAGGGDNAYGGSSANPSNTAIVIGKNSNTWNNGILFDSDSITGTDGSTGTGTAIRMAKGHILRWDGPSSITGSEIFSSVATNGKNVKLDMTDDSFKFQGTSSATILQLNHAASAVNYVTVTSAATGGTPFIRSNGTDSNISLSISATGTGAVVLRTNSNATTQLQVTHTASAVNNAQITGATTGNAPQFAVGGSDTDIDLYLAPKGTGLVRTPASLLAHSATAIPAGGTAGAGLRVSSTSNFGVFFGSGAPSLSAAKGSLYLRSDGTTTNDRAYINTNGSTTWTALTTVA
jgi:hypothetical protein